VVVCDSDATLVDAVELHAEAWAVTFAKYSTQLQN
jgi:beta-phosphoglucomutase-like phosphatase (HAD superfamily)